MMTDPFDVESFVFGKMGTVPDLGHTAGFKN
jgi:hypothetical protein